MTDRLWIGYEKRVKDYSFVNGSDKYEFGRIQNMKNGKMPDPNVIHPIPGYDKEIYVKPTIKNPNIIDRNKNIP